MDITVLPMMGYPIQKSPDQYLFSGSPKLIAAFHVFLRLLAPRHPPFALHSLATIKNTNKFKRFDANILVDLNAIIPKFNPKLSKKAQNRIPNLSLNPDNLSIK